MEQIPGPRGLPILGNLLDIRNPEGALKGLEKLIDIYGPVVQITLGGQTSVLVASADLFQHFTDESQWHKLPPQALADLSGPRALFLATNDDPDWGQAHRILAPAFGPLKIGEMFQGMQDIAYQMILKWSRQDEDDHILLTDDATRLTLDTIALCTMDYRFNSFYSTDMHPFVAAMVEVLELSQKLSRQPPLMKKYVGSSDKAKVDERYAFLLKTAQDIVERRRADPVDKNDMLNTLIHGKDPKNGATMRDALIGSEMVTFLVAGHETTSGLISFAFMNLLQNPRTYLKAQQEIDEVIGSRVIELEDLRKLRYLDGVLRETLRLRPTAPLINKIIPPHRKNEYVTICDGKYHIKYGTPVRLVLTKAMQDPAYFGADAADFIPERMMEDNPNFEKHMKAWKPFGNGTRSCIGQEFAWQETLLVMALILQNFDMSLANPGYQERIKQTLTIKPDQLYVKVKPRKGLDAAKIEQRLYNKEHLPVQILNISNGHTTNGVAGAGPLILYGSNSGTCQSLAQKLGSTFAVRAGTSATIQQLDSAVNNISTKQPLIVITASYEGQPTDDAARFVAWLETTKASLSGVQYAVFGCGHKNWHDTYQRIPTLIDHLLEEHGATPIIPMGATDVSQRKVLDDFSLWQELLLQKLRLHDSPSSDDVSPPEQLAEISTNMRAQQLSNGLGLAKVKEVRLLTQPGEPEKKHIEFELPEGITYEVGDYLSVLPINPDSLVRRIMSHWDLPRDAVITLKTKAFGSLPTNVPLGIYDLLKGFFELSQPVSKSNVSDLKQFTRDSNVTAALEKLLKDDKHFTTTVTTQHTSLFDLLNLHPAVKMPFQTFLACLLPLHVRQYSISSSPLANPQTCTITYTVVRHDSASTHLHEGVASTYLSTLTPGESAQVGIKCTATAHLSCPFRLPQPTIQSTTPLLMYCAGTGLAPFRGFIQQRAIMLQSNPDVELAPALLFIGCRSATADRLYADELAKWERLGVVSVRYAFSQEPNHELAKGCKYVGDRIRADAKEVRELWEKGARAYMCGSRSMQENVKEQVKAMFESEAKEQGWDGEELEIRREEFKKGLAQRAVSDIFD